MKKPPNRAAWALGLVLGLSSFGCAKETYLEVQLNGTLPGIYAIGVDLSLTSTTGATVHSHDVIKPGGVITLPASMAFKLDSESGILTVSAMALGAQGQELGTASNSTTIMHEQTWTIVLTFAPVASALTTDAGARADGS